MRQQAFNLRYVRLKICATPSTRRQPRGDSDLLTVPAPDTTESEATDSFRLLTLSALARMKLTSFRDKDRTHLRDLIEVGLLDASWVARFPSELGVRLQHLLDNSEG